MFTLLKITIISKLTHPHIVGLFTLKSLVNLWNIKSQLKEGTKTSRRMTDEIGISPKIPIHFECN